MAQFLRKSVPPFFLEGVDAAEAPDALDFLMDMFQERFGLDESARLSTALAFVIRDSSRIASAALVERDRGGLKGWYVWRIAVAPDLYRKGLGSELFGAIEDAAKNEEAPAVWLRTYPLKYPAMRDLLVRRGWAPVGSAWREKRRGIFEDWMIPLPPRPSRMLVIGGGGRGAELASAFMATGWVDLVGVVDVSADVSSKPIFASISRYNLVEDVPEALGVELAILALPHHLYGKVRPACLRRGWALLNEKPLAIDTQGCLDLQRQLADYPVPFVVGVQRRFHLPYLKLREEIVETGLRSIVIYAAIGRAANEAATGWRADPDLAGGGVLHDLGYHMLDLAQWMADAPLQPLACVLSCEGRIAQASEAEQEAVLIGAFANQDGRKIPCRIELSRISKVDEFVMARTGDGHLWRATREGLWCDGILLASENRQWDLALRGQCAKLVHASLVRHVLVPEELDEHLSLIDILGRARGMATNWSRNQTVPTTRPELVHV
jgi:predicted dehydrogenase/GNAT superfamily N-acetyltransferase